MEIRPVGLSGLPILRRASAPREASPVDGVQLSGAFAPTLSLGTSLSFSLGGLFGADPLKAQLQKTAETLMANGVQFRRRKKFLFITLKGWKDATASDVAKLVKKGKADRLQASTSGTGWVNVVGQHDLSLLDAFHGSGTPHSLPHAVMAQALLGMERAGVAMSGVVGGSRERIGAYGAYKALAESGVSSVRVTDLKSRELQVRDEEGALFAGWLVGQAPASALAAPLVAESVRALDDRDVDVKSGDVMETYRALAQSPSTRPLTLWVGDVELGASDVGAMQDPKAFAALVDERRFELDATKRAIGERALEAWDILRKDVDVRPFGERLPALGEIFKAGASAPQAQYEAAKAAPGPLADRAHEAASLLTALGPTLEKRWAAMFARVQGVDAAERRKLIDRVGAVLPSYKAIASLLPETRQDEALGKLLDMDAATLGRVDRIAGHLKGWQSEKTWTLGPADDGSLTIADNTSGQYADGIDASLTSPPFEGGKLSLGVLHRFEKNYDWAKLEVSQDGEHWKELAHYTGAMAQTTQTFDLPSGAVQLRFRIHSDGSNHDLGLRIDHPTVDGKPLDVHVGAAVLDAVLGGWDAPRLEALASLSEKIQDAHAAAAVLPMLDLAAGDFAERLESLATLTREWGVQGAQEAWPVLDAAKTGGIGERLARLRAARAICEATSREVRRADVLALFPKLEGVDASRSARALEVAKQGRTFVAEGTWGEVPCDGGTAWVDSPNGQYGINANTSVTTETLVLPQGARLAFDLKCATEERYDHAYVEVSRCDGRWETVADYTGARGGNETVDLSRYDGQLVKLRLRLQSDGSNTADGVSFGNLRVQGTGLDVPLADRINAPILRELLDACVADASGGRVDALAKLSTGMGSAQDACLLWPLLGSHVGQPGWDEKVGVLVDMQKAYGTQAVLDGWPRLEALGPASYRDRFATFQAAHKLAETLYSERRSSRAAEIYESLSRVGSDQALADSLTALATKGQPWIAEGSWARENGSWQDSPKGQYANNVDASLTSQPFVMRGGKLTVDAGYAFEQNYDWCAVEVSDDEKTWREVAKYTGTGTASALDLSRWDGKRIQVRFRVHTDGSNQADGISIKGLRLGTTPLDDVINAPLGSEMLAAAAAPDVPLDLRSRNVQAVARMADQLKSTVKAALLWPLLSPFQKSADFLDRAEALTGLAETYGVEAAFKMWPAVTSAGGPALLADRVALLKASFEAASVLFRDTTLEKALQVYGRLAASGADRTVFDTLGALIHEAPPWKSDGVWQAATDEKGRPSWDDSPKGQYLPNLDTSLTSAPFSLQGLTSCFLRFDARWVLEANYDNVYLEASENGRDWHELTRFTGDSHGRQVQEIDLREWCGRSLQLRWRLHTDGSNSGDGFTVSDVRLAVVDGAGGRAEVSLEDAINAPLTNELLDAATDTAHAAADRARSLKAVERMAKQVGGVQAAALLWPALSSHVGTPGFDALADQVGALAARFGVSATLSVMPVLQSEGTGTLAERVAVFSGAYGLASGALSRGRVTQAALELYRKMVVAGGEPLVGQALATFGDQLEAWTAEGKWAQETRRDGSVVWSDSPNAKYAENTEASLTSAPFLVPDGAKVTFSESHATEQNYDFCAVEVCANGKEWVELAKYTGSGSGDQSVDLGAYAGKTVQMRFRMHADGSNNAEGVSLWDVKLNGAPLEDVANEPFLFTVIAAATDRSVPADERAATFEFLRGLPSGWARRVLDFHTRQGAGVPLTVVVGRVAEGLPLGADLETCLTRSVMPARKEGRVEVGEKDVVVGGIRVTKRKA